MAKPETLPGPPRGRARAAAATEPRAGLVLGRYELVMRIGGGGMAVVWAGRQKGAFAFARLVAVKMMRTELAGQTQARRMFLREAEIASRIHHPNVVEVLDLGEEGTLVYQVMPLVDGESLATLLDGARAAGTTCPPAVAVRIVVDALAGLHAAHELRDADGLSRGVVHRDVSPQNVIVDRLGVARVADFGIAKAFTEETTGAMRGKLRYMSPEQIRGESLDRRSDVFAAGVLLWEALTCQRLFPGDNELAVIRSILEAPPRSLREFAPEVPSSVAAVVHRALEADRERRFATAAGMAAALETAGRDDNMLASTFAVASWVETLAGEALAERRRELERAATGTDPLTGTPAGRLADPAFSFAPARAPHASAPAPGEVGPAPAGTAFHASPYGGGASFARPAIEAATPGLPAAAARDSRAMTFAVLIASLCAAVAALGVGLAFAIRAHGRSAPAPDVPTALPVVAAATAPETSAAPPALEPASDASDVPPASLVGSPAPAIPTSATPGTRRAGAAASSHPRYDVSPYAPLRK